MSEATESGRIEAVEQTETRKTLADPSSGRHQSATLVAGTTAMFGLLVAIAVATAIRREPTEWHWDDWSAVVVSVLMGALFGSVAWILGRRQSELVRGVANVTLRDKAGAMGVDSYRAVAGSLDHGLNVGRHALSAIPLFEIADDVEQMDFATEVLRSYSSLLLNSIPSLSALPIGAAERLRRDQAAVADALVSFGVDCPGGTRTTVGAYLRRCLDIEEAGRRFATSGQHRLTLDLGLEFTPLLYQDELRVYHNWNAEHMDKTTHTLELHRGFAELASCFAPWYVGEDGVSEVDFTGVKRSDSATHQLSDICMLPRWKMPLTHGAIRACPAYRRKFIDGMARRMSEIQKRDGGPRAFPILVYELPDGSRIVLDGNHRLAAALRGPEGLDDIVYCYVIAEGSHPPVSQMISIPQIDGPDQTFSGFNPDVNRLREALEASRKK